MYRRDYDETGGLLRHKACSRVTKNYTPWPTIDPRPGGMEDTIQFLRNALPRYHELKAPLKLDNGVIDTYLDARSEADYLQLRAAKIAVALEMLKTLTLNLGILGAKEHVVDEDRFRLLVPKISQEIRALLYAEGFTEEEANSIASEQKVASLNRRSFRALLTHLLRYIDLKLSTKEMSLLLASRNKLVHTGYFYCQVATAAERRQCPPLSSAVEEYCFLTNTLDRIYLKLFGYSGTYIDWSTPGVPTRANLA